MALKDSFREEAPGRHEVERQLARMLANNILAKAPKQAAILRFVVEGALRGNEVTEKKIADQVFGGYDLDSAKVRVDVRLLRSRMRDYYAGPGNDDLVVITLPVGPAYRPAFAYSIKSACLLNYRRGLMHLSDPLRSELTIREAIGAFEEVVFIFELRS